MENNSEFIIYQTADGELEQGATTQAITTKEFLVVRQEGIKQWATQQLS